MKCPNCTALEAALAEKDKNTVSCVDYKHLTCTLCTQQKEQIAALTAENKELFEQGIAIMHDQGAENILLKEANMKQEEEIGLLREEKSDKVASAIAHRACCGTEHNPAEGKLHGYCVVCGVPWPCKTAERFLSKDALKSGENSMLNFPLKEADHEKAENL